MDVDKAFNANSRSRWQYQFYIRWAAHCKLHYGCANMQILFNENVTLTITALELDGSSGWSYLRSLSNISLSTQSMLELIHSI